MEVREFISRSHTPELFNGGAPLVQCEHKDLAGPVTRSRKGLRSVDGQAKGFDGAAQRRPLES